MSSHQGTKGKGKSWSVGSGGQSCWNSDGWISAEGSEGGKGKWGRESWGQRPVRPGTGRECMQERVRFRGCIKSFDAEKGYGFIVSAELRTMYKRDVFLHKAQLGKLQVGMEVTFSVVLNKRGMPQARKLSSVHKPSPFAPKVRKGIGAPNDPWTKAKKTVSQKLVTSSGTWKHPQSIGPDPPAPLKALTRAPVPVQPKPATLAPPGISSTLRHKETESLMKRIEALQVERSGLQRDLADAMEREKIATAKEEAAVQALAKVKEAYCREFAVLQAAKERTQDELATAAVKRKEAHDKEIMTLKAHWSEALLAAQDALSGELKKQHLLSRCLWLWQSSVTFAKQRLKCHRAAALVRLHIRKPEITAFKQDAIVQVQAQNHHKRFDDASSEGCGFGCASRPVLPGQPEHVASEDLDEQRQTSRERLDALGKELGELCLCPISFQPMTEPVLGADLRTYQKDVIETALDTNPASPFTRGYMEKDSLRPNMLASAVLELMAKYFPDWEATTASQRPAPPPLVREELHQALREGKAEQAVELLGRDVDPRILNRIYTYREQHMTLLHLCICLRLPKVACAVIDRSDFRRVETYSSKGLLAAHIAAAFNYADVCEKIREHFGASAFSARTLAACELVDPSGRSIKIPLGSTGFGCARLFGHQLNWRLDHS